MYKNHFQQNPGRRSVPLGSVAVRILCLTGLFVLGPGLFIGGESLCAAEPDKSAGPSAGLLNDWMRREFRGAAKWDIGGQFRTRYEAKDAGSFPNRDFARALDSGNDYLLFRTRAHVGWSPARWFTAFLEGQDARAAGDARTPPESDRLDLYQAYLQVGDPRIFPFTLKVGRQEMIYGDQRYVGISDWSNFGRSFDAVKLRFQNDVLWMDVFAGRPVPAQDGRFNNANHAYWFSGLYTSTRRLAPWQETDLFILANNVSGTGARDVYTVGTRWKSLPGKLGSWDYSFEAAGQFGRIPEQGKRRDHRGYAVHAGAGHTWQDSFGAPRLGLGYDFGTGDSDPADDRSGTFQTIFGTNHSYYGNMDLMGLRNMHIARLEASLKPSRKVTVSTEWLVFWLADGADFLYPESGPGRNQNGYGRNPLFGSHVGHEIDLLADWRPTPWGKLRVGYGHFFIGGYIRRSVDSVPANGGAAGADWCYMQYGIDF